jgi:hypothetical protein
MMRGPKAAAAPAFCKKLRRIRSKCQVVFIRCLLPAVCRPVIPFVDYERIRLLSENTCLRGRRLR